MKTKDLLMLFKETFLISAFTVGGGYVMVPLMKAKFVDELQIIEEEEMLNLIAVGQSAPGAFAINSSILLGYKLHGVIGALVCCLATCLPPLIIISIISYFYHAFNGNEYVQNALLGMRAGVTSLIIIAVYKMFLPYKSSKKSIIIIGLALLLALKFSSIYIIIGTIIASAVFCLYKYKRGEA